MTSPGESTAGLFRVVERQRYRCSQAPAMCRLRRLRHMMTPVCPLLKCVACMAPVALHFVPGWRGVGDDKSGPFPSQGQQVQTDRPADNTM